MSVITPKSRNNRYRRLSSGKATRRQLRSSVLRISDMAEDIYIHNLHKRIDVPSRDATIRRLVETFNEMIGRLEKDVSKQVFFITDASHEMRTPIAVIKGYADLISRWGKDNPLIMKESIEAIQMEAKHLNSLIASLLALARDDTKILEKEIFGNVSLNATAVAVIKEMTVSNNNVRIELDERSSEEIHGVYDMVLQLFRLFLDNARKYSKDANDPVMIIISGDSYGSYLTFKDTGIGISGEDLPFIFERFYRADKSHNNKTPGFGLGLAIADMIARAHGATITVYSELDTGTEFTVSFPKHSE